MTDDTGIVTYIDGIEARRARVRRRRANRHRGSVLPVEREVVDLQEQRYLNTAAYRCGVLRELFEAALLVEDIDRMAAVRREPLSLQREVEAHGDAA